MCLAHTLKLTINKKLRIHPKKKVEEVMWFWIGVLMPQPQLFYFIEKCHNHILVLGM